ncbi:putative dynein beta chain, ciliary [Bradyrhizobium oligotrophicum S58]|uniref:Putative dynein beta chain, ciliary n=1 Tax=Bradyrhizobium oligotrophicum S58 TaxID=1245469 RepID=M4ZAL4_9BRAD|nr:hypothetical protein [Bradyrhizobium oligotrophicum]BAM90789.1 putative dynein beta chain, ciliary [Bradyrhizobium oligotrophicum S58]
MSNADITENDLDVMEIMISVMRSKDASAETAVLAAEAIAAHARFNIRFGNLKEALTKSDDEMLALLDESEALVVSCRNSVKVFHETGDKERLHASLVHLRDAFDKLAI